MNQTKIKLLAQTKPDTYPRETPCITCGHMWGQHKGELCPKCFLCGRQCAQHIIGREPQGVTEPVYLDWPYRGDGATVTWGWCHMKGVTTFLVDISLLETNRDIPGFDT